MEFESITSDNEIAIINAISKVFVGISRFNYYFHYKKNIADKLRKKGFLKKKNQDDRFKEVKEIINILGRIPLEYDDNTEYFNLIAEDIKKRYPYINSYPENHNLYPQRKLGRKYNLNWDVFINFIKQEFKCIKSILTKTLKKILKYFQKRLNSPLKNIQKMYLKRKH